MNIKTELKQWLVIAWQQFTQSGRTGRVYHTDTREIHFTRNFQVKAKSWGLTEADARDVYEHGYSVKDSMLVRKYNGYEIGIYYFLDPQTGRTIVTSIWKRDRR